MSRPRSFDHEEAVALYNTGCWTQAELARRYGVSTSMIYQIVIPGALERARAAHARWQSSGRCVVCGAPAARRAGTRVTRCRYCAAKSIITTVREDTLECSRCHAWKPDVDYPHHRGQDHRRFRHSVCRACHTAIKREYRERTRVPCAGGCGKLVNSVDRRPRDTHPPSCHTCARARREAGRAVA